MFVLSFPCVNSIFSINKVFSDKKGYCQTPGLGLRLGVEFVFPLSQEQEQQEQEQEEQPSPKIYLKEMS